MLSQQSTTPAPAARVRRGRRTAGIASAVAISFCLAMIVPGTARAAQSPIGLGTAGSFAVLAGSGITNTGTTTVTGDIGSFPTPTRTGLRSMVLTGVDHGGDAVTQQAKIDLNTAYTVAAGASPPTSVATELGGTTLTPGVYNGATLQITGTLTLDTVGDPNAVFVFQTPETLITASNSAVVVLNGVRACNVYWQVGSSATLGTGSALVGTVLASTSITATTAATVQGRLLALNGAVTLDTNTITNTGCATGPTTTSSSAPPTTPTTVVPAPPGSTPVRPPASTPVPRSTPRAEAIPGVTPGSPSAPGLGTDTDTDTDTDLTGATPSAPPTNTTQRPALPFTGFDPRFPFVGGLALALGILLLGVSRRGAERHNAARHR